MSRVAGDLPTDGQERVELLDLLFRLVLAGIVESAHSLTAEIGDELLVLGREFRVPSSLVRESQNSDGPLFLQERDGKQGSNGEPILFRRHRIVGCDSVESDHTPVREDVSRAGGSDGSRRISTG